MSFTNRPMFQQAQQIQATAKDVDGVVQNLNAEIDGAQNYEQVMNAIRGDQATIPERRVELSQLVGRDDAMQTPESVLTLVQPVVEMATIDQGIGELAQTEMAAPVTGDMAGGIMSMPVQKFAPGGEVKTPDLKSLQEYYQSSLPVVRDIYGGTDEAAQAARGAALFNLADRGLRLAAGQSPAEAFQGIGSDLSKQAAGLRQQDQAIKAAALELAGKDRAADRTLLSEQLKARLKREEDRANAKPLNFILNQDTVVNVQQPDGSTKKVTIPQGFQRTMTNYQRNDLSKTAPTLAQNFVLAPDSVVAERLGQKTVVFPQEFVDGEITYKANIPYNLTPSEISRIEAAGSFKLMAGDSSLAALLKPEEISNFKVINPAGITFNGRDYAKGDQIGLTPSSAKKFEGSLAPMEKVKAADDKPEGTKPFRLLADITIDGTVFKAGTIRSLTASQEEEFAGNIVEVQTERAVPAFVPEDNPLYRKDGTLVTYNTREEYQAAIESGDFTTDNNNKNFATPQYLYKWDGSSNEIVSAKNHKEVKEAIGKGFGTSKYVPNNDVRFKPDGEAIVFDINKSGALASAVSDGFTLTSAPIFEPKILYSLETGKADVAQTAAEFVSMVKNNGFTNIAPPLVKGVNYNENNNPMPYDNEIQKRAAIEKGYIYSSPDRPGEFVPETRFNEAGDKVVSRSLQEFGDNMMKGFYLTEKIEPGAITPSSARRSLLTLSPSIKDGTASPEQIAEFQMAITTIQGNPRLIYDGTGFKAVGGAIPPTVVDAVRQAKARDANFNDMGLLEEPAVEYTPDFPTLITPGVDYSEAVGGSGRFKQAIGRITDVLRTFTPDAIAKLSPGGLSSALTQRETRAAADDIFSLNTITITRSLGSIAGKENAALIARLEALQADPYSFFTDPNTARSKVGNLIVQLEAVVETSKQIQVNNEYSQSQKTQAAQDVADLEFLIGQYKELEKGLQPKGGVVNPLNYLR